MTVPLSPHRYHREGYRVDLVTFFRELHVYVIYWGGFFPMWDHALCFVV